MEYRTDTAPTGAGELAEVGTVTHLGHEYSALGAELAHLAHGSEVDAPTV
jgi:hypothetical protein